jgi:hypothetical protein
MTYVKIATATIGATAATIQFTSIPQTYTDLMLLISVKNSNGGTPQYSMNFAVNGSPLVLTRYIKTEQGVSVTISQTNTQVAYVANSGTGSTFSNVLVRIPSYTSSVYKFIYVEDGTNYYSNGSESVTGGQINTNSAITSITLSDGAVTNFVQYSTATLYGILAGGTGATITTA